MKTIGVKTKTYIADFSGCNPLTEDNNTTAKKCSHISALKQSVTH